MSANEVKQFFDTYIFGFIFSDIEREINLAKSQRCGGNFLCALGLLCYTEFMGEIVTGNFSRRYNKSNFDAFFNKMGADYQEFNQHVEVYDVFRNGMAHEYFIKKNFVITMLRGEVNLYATMNGKKPSLSGGSSMLIGPVHCGVGILDDGRYYFAVEQYYDDFSNVCRNTYELKMSDQNPTIPRAFPDVQRDLLDLSDQET